MLYSSLEQESSPSWTCMGSGQFCAGSWPQTTPSPSTRQAADQAGAALDIVHSIWQLCADMYSLCCSCQFMGVGKLNVVDAGHALQAHTC